MVRVGDLSERGLTGKPNEADLSGGESDMRELPLLGHELGNAARTAYQLRPFAGVEFDGMDLAAHRDLGQRKGVPYLYL